jgi:hypothetical protein
MLNSQKTFRINNSYIRFGEPMIYEYDVLIIGGGIVGLVTALTAAEKCRVASTPQENRSYASYIEDQEKNTSTTLC